MSRDPYAPQGDHTTRKGTIGGLYPERAGGGNKRDYEILEVK